uniref:DNA-directed RNA polymerase n=1 Tax=Geranium phaeum TaxID=379952 RepID=A0A0G2T5U3_9ROSI|nr:RNA polymerase alpha subunit [Geranium phaeum]AMY96151.1 RNA polymerase alpha subunit [Geranium phaeum]
MSRKKVRVSIQTPRWKCVESRADGKRLYYGRFIMAPLEKGQADIIGIAMRRALLGEIDGTCITHAKFDKIPHEYTTIVGIQESIDEILLNLKEIVLRSNLYGTRDASICVRGPRNVTAQDIILPNSVAIVDNTQHIVTLTEPIDFCVGLTIERNSGYYRQFPMLTDLHDDRGYSINAVFEPVKNVNHSIHSYENESHEMLFLEIWTNGSLTPKEALREASRKVINLFIPFLDAEEENFHFVNNQNEHTDELSIRLCALKAIYIDQLVGLPPRLYNGLKRAGIHTVLDLLEVSDIQKITGFSTFDVFKVMDILNKNLQELRSKSLL